ncbi:MAG: DNA cytosine methyltransferase [Cellulosilyticaceae bacterium]
MKEKINLIDIFCGCGGFSKGFENAGYNVKMGIDIWADASNTYKKNFPNAIALNQDINNITAEEILIKLKCSPEEIDIIIGGPPCQGFSVSGKRMIDDPRNSLYKGYVKLISDIRPKVFVMENVPGLVNLFKGQVRDQILEDFKGIGYNVTYKQLIAADYGVPQVRKRVFFVGLNRDIYGEQEFVFPEETHGTQEVPYITCEEAISDLPLLENNIKVDEVLEYSTLPVTSYQSKMRQKTMNKIYNHIPTIHNQKTVDIISLVPDGGNYKDLPEELRATRNVNIAWTRMNSKKACFTIDTGHNHHFHYKANRVPTCRESARIQSFSDDFIFYGTKTSQLKQVGNAVPPLLAEAIAKEIRKLV